MSNSMKHGEFSVFFWIWDSIVVEDKDTLTNGILLRKRIGERENLKTVQTQQRKFVRKVHARMNSQPMLFLSTSNRLLYMFQV